MTRPNQRPVDLSWSSGTTVAIVGLGLLGASLAKRLRQSAPGVNLLGYARRPETVRQALDAGLIDHGSSEPQDILPQADLTVICIPVAAIIAFAVDHRQLWRPGSVVTDVGSVKHEIVKAVTPVLARRHVHFIGSHPMAGSEQTGLESASADLYDQAIVFVTPEAESDHNACATVHKLWELAGARTHSISAAEHDALVARTSHLLHLLAAIAVTNGLRRENGLLATAGGFRDVTRIAAASPEMWTQIFDLNRDELLKAIAEFNNDLSRLGELIRAGNWSATQDYLTQAAEQRRQWQQDWQTRRREND